MKCPKCDTGEFAVVNSNPCRGTGQPTSLPLVRVRRCLGCGYRARTEERIVGDAYTPKLVLLAVNRAIVELQILQRRLSLSSSNEERATENGVNGK